MNLVPRGAGWLYAYQNDPKGFADKVTYTLAGIPPGTFVFATIALSAFSQGVAIDEHLVGTVGSLVRSVEQYNPDGSTTTYELLDYDHNTALCENCASVTFELTAFYARAYAMFTTFSL